jgi:uncharacterized protein with HEPN domain
VPPWDWRLRIQDILDASVKIARYTDRWDFETFAADDRTADAVTRNLEIIGEAARSIPASVRARHPDVPWRLMRDVQNVLIHDYPGVDLEVVWKTISEDLPPIIARLRELLALERASEAGSAE